MLDVARDPWVDQPGRPGGIVGQGSHLGQVGNPRRGQPSRDRLGKEGDVRLLRIGPGQDVDEVDLAAVEPTGHHCGLEAPRPKTQGGSLGGPIKRVFFVGAGDASEHEHRALLGDLEDLRAPVATQMEPSWTRRPGSQLVIDVLDMGAAHDEHMDPGRTERLDATAHRVGIGLAIGHRGAVPVEDQGLEGLVGDCRAEAPARLHSPSVPRAGAVRQCEGPSCLRSGRRSRPPGRMRLSGELDGGRGDAVPETVRAWPTRVPR